jgi:diacylglycerol kinase family enzyme
MGKEKACLVIHPKAERYVSGVVSVLEARWDVTQLVTAYAGHGMVVAQNAPQQGYRWVIALGGDGTLNEIVNGVAKAWGNCTVGVLPGGTANQWAHEIGLPAHPVDAAHALLSCTTRKADIGHVAVQELGFPLATLEQQGAVSSSTARDHFLLTAGLGLDAAVIRRTADSFRQRYGQLAFYLTWLETFPRIHHIPVRIQWSSNASWEGQPREVLVSNTRHYGSVVDVAPEAYVNDGLLDIRLFWYTEMLFYYVQDRSFSLRVPASVAMHLDGSSVQLADFLSRENWARLQEATDLEKVMVTYRFDVKPAALSVAVPREYAGDLFDGRRESDAAQSDAPARTSVAVTSVVVPAADAPVAKSQSKAFRATRVSSDPLAYIVQDNGAGPFLRISDVILRENNDPKEIFAHLIRMATGGVWSHSALLCSLGDPSCGLNETFLIESRPRHTQLVSWRDEVVPFDQFTVGIKRPRLDWYVETPEEASRHDPADPEDGPGIDYLRHVCGIAVDQINSLYDYKAVFELAVLYLERIAKRHLGADRQAIDAGMRQPEALPHIVHATTSLADLFKMGKAVDYAGHLERATEAQLGVAPELADRAAGLADFFKTWEGVPAISDFFKQWKEANYSANSVMRFICSGLEQYSFFEALRRRIMNDLAIPAHRDAAMSNLGNMQRVIFRDDPEGLIPTYVQQVQSGKRAISDPVPDEVLDLLKTAVPMDFNASPNLEWHYIIRRGVVWRIEEAPEDYTPQSTEEKAVLAMLCSERTSPQSLAVTDGDVT